MDTPDERSSQNRARDKILYRYHRALKRADFATVARILAQARQDTALARDIREFNETLAREYQANTRATPTDLQVMKDVAAQSAHPLDATTGRVPANRRALAPSSGPGLRSSLRFPDHPAWHDQPRYSAHIASALAAAYRSLHADPGYAGLRVASRIVRPFLNESMALPQRTAINYLCALAHMRDDDYQQALELIDIALEIAVNLSAPGTLADLLYLRAGCHHALGRMKLAAQYSEECLHLMQNESHSSGPADATFELAAHTQLVGYKFMLAEYEVAQRYLEQAQLVLIRAQGDALIVAGLQWNWALLYQLTGQPYLALNHAMEAAHTYSTSGSLPSAARIQSLTADISLDVAQGLPSGSDKSLFVTLAHAHAESGLQYAREASDTSGEGLVRLAAIRCSRIAGENQDRVAAIERIIRAANRRADVALLAQAWTALGDELAFLGEREQALTRYHSALDVLEGSDLFALRTKPHRALLRAAEMIS